jgi:predicted transcriptional regulator
MKQSKSATLSGFELEIMHVIWDKGRATAQEVKGALSHVHPGADSTFRTMMRRMEKKGVLEHEMHEDGRTFIYKPLITREAVSRKMFRDMYHKLFRGSSERLQDAMDALFREEEITTEEIQRLRKLIVEKGEQDE